LLIRLGTAPLGRRQASTGEAPTRIRTCGEWKALFEVLLCKVSDSLIVKLRTEDIDSLAGFHVRKDQRNRLVEWPRLTDLPPSTGEDFFRNRRQARLGGPERRSQLAERPPLFIAVTILTLESEL
jgi:hypothetical protein